MAKKRNCKRKARFKPEVRKIKLNPEQAVLLGCCKSSCSSVCDYNDPFPSASGGIS
ncbi:MAG: hypothetical protein PHY56_07130 [Candidatus Omnitrophica bacterium]|nr:hypothetical protein [Candidatus Omnitrophota bacterium]